MQLLLSLLLSPSSLVFPCLSCPCRFWQFCLMSLHLGLSGVFLMTEGMLTLFGRTPQKWRIPHANMSFIIRDVDVDTLVKVASSSLLIIKLPSFPFLVNRYLEGDILRLCKLFVLRVTHYFQWTLFTIVITLMFSRWWFSISLFASTLIGIIRKSCLFPPPIHLLNGTVDSWMFMLFYGLKFNNCILLLKLLFRKQRCKIASWCKIKCVFFICLCI